MSWRHNVFSKLCIPIVFLIFSFKYFTMISDCLVCKKEISKYKCSKCLLPYCSLPCWNLHKDSIECETTAKHENKDDTSAERLNLSRIDFVTKDTVPKDQLMCLGSSENLKNLLKNPHLRAILSSVDSSKDPSKAVHEAMLEPLFVEFADECLKVIEETT